MSLAQELADKGLSYEDAAAQLNDAGITIARGARKGALITVDDIQRRIRSGEFPSSWRIALELEDPAAVAATAAGAGAAPGEQSQPSGRRREQAPQRPANVKPVPVPIEAGARKRIAGGYRAVGGLAAVQVSRTHGKNTGEGIAAVFNDYADPIADLWLRAAEENPFVARIVNAVNGGGVTGDLIGTHILLALSCIYILGAPLPDALFAKYSKHRVVVNEPTRNGKPTDPRAESAPVDGAAADPVG